MPDTVELDILAELYRVGAVLLGYHFVYKSGKHGDGYVNMDPLFTDVELVDRICAELVRPFENEYDTMAGPATGGVLLAYACAMQTPGQKVAAVWADKCGDGFAFERAGFAQRLTGQQVLVVEDLLTTGGSVKKVCEAARMLGANIVGVTAICNRGGVTAEQLGVPRLETLAEVNFTAVDPDQCPLCKLRVPIVADIGHGAEYKTAHPNYKGGYATLLA